MHWDCTRVQSAWVEILLVGIFKVSLQNEILYVFTSIAFGPKEVCGFIIGDSCGDYYNPWKQNWTVSFSDKPKPPVKTLPTPNVRIQYASNITSLPFICAVKWQHNSSPPPVRHTH